MKTLLHSTVWCPEDQELRKETLRKHLIALHTYNGEFDILISTNAIGPKVKEIIESETKNLNCTIEEFQENEGWAYSRNSAIKKTIEENYDLCIMMDCDIWVEDLDWIIKSQKAAVYQPVFMVRMDEDKNKIMGRTRMWGMSWDTYDEWLGCINVATRKALLKVGGYNYTDLPRDWGFHDCLWGRQLSAAKLLELFNGYPSLYIKGVIEEQDETYNQFLDPLKELRIKEYGRKFWKLSDDIMSGKTPPFYDYTLK